MDALMSWLGYHLGYIGGKLVAIAGAAVVLFFVWGVWWDRILSKAGFLGKQYWLIFGALYMPLLLAFVSEEILDLPQKITEFLIGLGILGTFGGLVAIALLPWPVRRRKKTDQREG